MKSELHAIPAIAKEIKELEMWEKRLEHKEERLNSGLQSLALDNDKVVTLLTATCPELYKAQLVEKNLEDETDQSVLDKAIPRAIGYSVICTDYDAGHDSGGDGSEYGLFILVSNGRIHQIAHLGMYWGSDRDESYYSWLEILARKLPKINDNHIDEVAPQCVSEVNRLTENEARNSW
jgi:hypothetical protein